MNTATPAERDLPPLFDAEPVAWYDARSLKPVLEVGARPPVWGGDWKPVYARAALASSPASPVPESPCVVCGSDEPYRGTCGGAKDSRALCLQAAPAAQAVPSPAPSLPLAHVDNAPLGFTLQEKSAWSVGFEQALAAPVAQPEPSEGEARDAARYRFLRDQRGGDHTVVNGQLLEGAALDEEIDALIAILAAPASQGGQTDGR